MKRINFILMGKGGVGKSLVSWMLAQYYQHKGLPLYCADTDPTNASFSRYTSLNVEHLQLLTKSMVVNTAGFDSLIERLISHEGVSVIDNGASSFLPLVSYIADNNLFEFLSESGHEVVVHTPIVGGPALNDTISGLEAILSTSNVKVVLWQNEYFGPVQINDTPLQAMPVVKQNANRVLGIVRIRERDAMTFGADIRQATEMGLTLEQADTSPSFRIMQKQRLRMVQRDLFGQFDHIGL